jgi:hypothetical protein
MYDGDTVSVLQPLDIIGSALPHGHIVEADTQVKAYWLDTAQMSGLPDRLRMVSEEECDNTIHHNNCFRPATGGCC